MSFFHLEQVSHVKSPCCLLVLCQFSILLTVAGLIGIIIINDAGIPIYQTVIIICWFWTLRFEPWQKTYEIMVDTSFRQVVMVASSDASNTQWILGVHDEFCAVGEGIYEKGLPP